MRKALSVTKESDVFCDGFVATEAVNLSSVCPSLGKLNRLRIVGQRPDNFLKFGLQLKPL